MLLAAKICHEKFKFRLQKIAKKTLQMDISFKNIDLFDSINAIPIAIKKAIETREKKGLILSAKSKKVRVLFRSLLLLRAVLIESK